MGSPNLLETVLMLSWLALNEISRHILYSVYGKTESGAIVDIGRAVARRCGACRTEDKLTRVVPDSGSERADMQRSAEDCNQTASLVERRTRLVSLVAATNFSDVIEIFLVTSFFLIAKINPLAGATAPQAVE